MTRRRSIPWIYRWSRPLIGAIAILGALITGYLTFEKLTGSQVTCQAGCDIVLSSPYASIFGLPLSLFGCLAYITMAALALFPLLLQPDKGRGSLRSQAEDITWLLLLVGAVSMVVFSGYLMFVLATQIKAFCPYCITSAIFSLTMLIMTIKGRDWPELGQIFFAIVAASVITLVGTLAVYANVNKPNALVTGNIISRPTTYPEPPNGWEIKTVSGPAELALSDHLKKIGAKMYGAWWCPHCFDQKQLFGHDAAKNLPYTECAEKGINPNPDACVAAKVESFPTWVIKGKTYSGTLELKKLAEYSGYKGPVNFKYSTK